MVACTAVTSCVRERMEPCGGGQTRGDHYLSLRVRMERGTRAGSENGAGVETGYEYESKISNILLYFVEKGTLPAGQEHVRWTDNNKKIIAVVKADIAHAAKEGDDMVFLVRMDHRISDYTKEELFVVANVNPQDLEGLMAVKTVGELRDYHIRQTYVAGDLKRTPWKCRSFTMTPATTQAAWFDGADNAESDGTWAHPWVSDVTLQRLAARVDLAWNDKAVQVDAANGWLMDQSSPVESCPRITRIIPLNMSDYGTYAIARRAAINTAASGLTSGSTVYNTFNADLYTIAPNTLVKKGATEEQRRQWFGNTVPECLRADAEGYGLAGLDLSEGFLNRIQDNPAYTGFENYTKYITVRYADENTQHVSLCSKDNVTGLLVEATLVHRADGDPVFDDRGLPQGYGTSSDSYTGRTFWAMMDPSNNYTSYWFSTQEAAEAAVNVKNGHNNTLGYYYQEYTEGKCWYLIWLRHAVPDADPDYNNVNKPTVGEYSIERNNIYRVALNIRGLGMPEPEPVDPDERGLLIWTVKWDVRTEPEIKW